ncbi:MAG TPA: type 1 glutamine amidotransferase [Gaiellaceae bacterium]|jgi:GMP synthase-like glutamine amidotransferase
MRVLSITHGSDVGPELVGDVVRDQGHELIAWDMLTQGRPPEADAVLVFGGAQNVGEELQHPWLHEEYEALRRWLDRGTPLFAVCLGAQTLAHAAGGEVAKAPQTYLGFVPAELTDDGLADPVLGVLPRQFEALNANAYQVFSLPERSVSLARSGTLEQAFRVGERAWAVQFHPEVRRDQIVAWFAEEKDPPRSLNELAAEVDAGIDAWQEHGRALAHAFLHVASR